ncbi:MAG: hypothetical protein WAL98_12650 [Desulfatiglandaceae bacterium]
MDNEVVPNLTLFFRPFLKTPEGMDGYLGLKSSHWRAPELLEA